MSTLGGPYTERDGLVFGIDTGFKVFSVTNTTRNYKGFPVINSINGGANRANAITNPTLGSHGAAVVTSIITDGERENVFRIYSTNTTGYYMVNQQSSIINTSGNIYTYSFDYKMIRGTSTAFSPSAIYKNGYKTPDATSSGTNITDTTLNLKDGWKRFIRTYTSTYTGYNLYRTNLHTDETANFEVLFDNFMVNEGIPTPFVDDTRSSTQSLIDLTKTRDIDVSNVSFDSTGQPTFDGTNDSILISNPGVSSSSGFSMELVIKQVNASNSPMVVTPNSYGIDHFIRFNSNGTLYVRMIPAPDSSAQDFTTTSVLTSTDYHHIAFTFSQSQGGRLYYNGGLEASAAAAFTAVDWTGSWWMGQRGNNTYFFQGEIPVFKVYNKILTPQEIQQNYNSYKNRFNL